MIYLTVVCVILVILCGYILWAWREDKKHCHGAKTEETKRLYAFIDDMFDRIGSGDIQQYAFTQRIKKEIFRQQELTPEQKIKTETERPKTPPQFVQKR